MSVASQRMCTLSQPTDLIRLAVAHMQMHHESPALGGEMIFCHARPRQGETINQALGMRGRLRTSLHCHAFWFVISQKSPVPHEIGSPDVWFTSFAHTRCV